MHASQAFALPCPWAPLQSMTAAASRRSRAPRVGGNSARGMVAVSARFAVGSATTSWGFGPFRRFSSGDRNAGLPLRHRPLSGFLTLSAVYSRPGPVALFRATSALRVSVFRAFPARPAVTSFGVRCSLAVPVGPEVAARDLVSTRVRAGGFRALLRPSVRSRAPGVIRAPEPMLS